MNRLIRWTGEGLEYEANQRHAEAIVKDMKLEGGKVVVTPCSTESDLKDDLPNDDVIEDWKTDTLFRGIAARLNFLAADRPDLQYASNGTSKHMSKPSARGWRLLKRVARYLIGSARTVQKFDFCKPDFILKGFGASDWAGDRATGKSNSGGALRGRATS